MALQTAGDSTAPSAQTVGNAFVEQYYHILHTSPELVYRFYQDSSVLSRPDANGVMTSVATMQGINEKILSLNFKDCKAEIKTADAQKSYNEAVTVYVEDTDSPGNPPDNGIEKPSPTSPGRVLYSVLVLEFLVSLVYFLSWHHVLSIILSFLFLERSHVLDPPAPDPATSGGEEHTNIAERVDDQFAHANNLVNGTEVDVGSEPHSNGNGFSVVTEAIPSPAEEDTPKKSYASIVIAKGSSGPRKVYLPASTEKVAPKKTENQSSGSAGPEIEAEAAVPSGNDAQKSSNDQEEVEGHSIYIRNLPYNMSADQLESEFKKFGPVKEGGVQIRYNRTQGYCFGFIEFHSQSSMNNAAKLVVEEAGFLLEEEVFGVTASGAVRIMVVALLSEEMSSEAGKNFQVEVEVQAGKVKVTSRVKEVTSRGEGGEEEEEGEGEGEGEAQAGVQVKQSMKLFLHEFKCIEFCGCLSNTCSVGLWLGT
ncbi:hypothetical protein Tsubulata_015186 [Turnera subulata]|uniref:NTF2 domain-containing protein n=1 Tax=Turnera subulata TaxID=218843 RepID=A0A9Q0F6Z3_9ROSI|nr:hypothetical protein Tsubulata_015186 [Turnera subulata]